MMKSIVYNIVIAVAIFIAIPGYAQTKNESWLAKSAKDVQAKLNLTDNVTGQLLSAMTNMMHAMQTAGTNTNAENRKVQMHRIRADYYAQVKSLLTLQQWTLYQEIEASSGERFKKQMKAKKIPVKELD